MPTQLVPDVIGVNVRGTMLGVPVENTFFYEYVAVPDESEIQTLVNDLSDYWEENGLELLPAAWVGNQIYARDLAAPITVQATADGLSGLPGTLSGEPLPSYATLAVARRSGLTGRSSRGRIFWMGLGESWTSGNTYSTTVVNGIEAFLVGMDNVASVLGFTPVIVSRYTAGALRPTGVAYPLTTWSVNNLLVDTRRSRKAAE